MLTSDSDDTSLNIPFFYMDTWLSDNDSIKHFTVIITII